MARRHAIFSLGRKDCLSSHKGVCVRDRGGRLRENMAPEKLGEIRAISLPTEMSGDPAEKRYAASLFMFNINEDLNC